MQLRKPGTHPNSMCETGWWIDTADTTGEFRPENSGASPVYAVRNSRTRFTSSRSCSRVAPAP